MINFEEIDIEDENDQDKVLITIGQAMANVVDRTPEDIARIIGAPEEIQDWLSQMNAYFIVKVGTN